MLEALLPLRPAEILLVDDEPGFLGPAKQALCDALACRVTEATNLADAANLIEEQSFDLLVLDCQLPRSGEAGARQEPDAGVRLLKKAERARPGVPAIVVSGRGYDRPAVQAVARGATYLVKADLEKSHFEQLVAASRRHAPPLKELPPLREFEAIPGDGKKNLHLRIQQEHDSWILGTLRQKGWCWMLVCGDAIVQASSNVDDVPTRVDLERISAERQAVPLFFFRPPGVESRLSPAELIAACPIRMSVRISSVAEREGEVRSDTSVLATMRVASLVGHTYVIAAAFSDPASLMRGSIGQPQILHLGQEAYLAYMTRLRLEANLNGSCVDVEGGAILLQRSMAAHRDIRHDDAAGLIGREALQQLNVEMALSPRPGQWVLRPVASIPGLEAIAKAIEDASGEVIAGSLDPAKGYARLCTTVTRFADASGEGASGLPWELHQVLSKASPFLLRLTAFANLAKIVRCVVDGAWSSREAAAAIPEWREECFQECARAAQMVIRPRGEEDAAAQVFRVALFEEAVKSLKGLAGSDESRQQALLIIQDSARRVPPETMSVGQTKALAQAVAIAARPGVTREEIASIDQTLLSMGLDFAPRGISTDKLQELVRLLDERLSPEGDKHAGS